MTPPISSSAPLGAASLAFRPAQKADCRAIATLYSLSSDGVANYIWSKLAEPHETLLDVGQRRYEREGTPFSYQNATLATVDGAIAGMLVAFPMTVDPTVAPETDPILAPFSHLEEDNSYYICGIALFPEYRQQGIGQQLMQIAETHASAQGFRKLSLIVLEQKTHVKRWYERLGFREVKRQPIVPHPLIQVSGDALLMVKHLP